MSRIIQLNRISIALKWWPLSQRIRTFREKTFEVVLLEAKEPPKYLQVSEKALRLNQLGIRNEAIARHIGVDGKTVAKALNCALDRY